jgi:hypothetical protein
MQRVLPADTNAESVPLANALLFAVSDADADAEPNVDAERQHGK